MFRQLSQLVLQAPKKVIHMSYWRFAFWWGLILFVHVVTCSFNAFYAYGYWNLSKSYLGVCLDFYQIGMPEPNHRTISAVHGIVAFIHGLCIVLMLGGSLRQRSLAFTPWSSSKATNSVKTERTNSSKLSGSFSRAYGKIMYPFALCGVNGKYFDVALVCREIVETALQTVQAYRMSVLLPRTLLNRFYVILLVTNCWSSIVADSVFFGRDEARRRFACIVLDCILDLFASTGVQLLVMANYVAAYDHKIKGFDESIWYDDEWVARALNEFRMVVVVSWSDLLSRTIFSLGLVITTTSMKRLLWRLPRNVNRVTQSTASIVFAVEATKKFLSRKKDKIQGPTTVEAMIQEDILTIRSKLHRAHGDRIILRSMHLLFGAWGILILGFHIHASVQPTLAQCFMQVRPWAVSRPSCYLVGLDCHFLNISGEKEHVQVMWAEFDASTVVQVLIRHCSGLEMPDIISNFIGIHGIKVYNSTILEWGESAAITNTKHPELALLLFARVNMTDGLLPIGLHSPDFPPSLTDIEFCVTNLQSLPDNLSTKWPRGGIIYLERSELTVLPRELVLLEPGYLSVAGNPITEITSEVFQIPNLRVLSVSATKLRELPRDVTRLGASLTRIYLVDTEIAFFWSWMDNFVERTKGKKAPIRAANSDYCRDLENIQTGRTDSFRVPNSLEYANSLMNPSQDNRQAILTTVDCTIYTDDQFYPLSFEDKLNAISIPPMKNR